MKAAQIYEYGDPSVVQIVDVATPNIGANQVLVEVHASSINPFDSKIRAGYMKEMIPLTLPVTLGGDIAGVVTEVGSDVTNVMVGDNVYGQANAVAGNSGAFAEFAATAAAQVAKAPKNINFNESASLALVGASAVQALNHHINLKSGQKIFIHGGSGGIGSIAIQIAKHIGAYVATTATGDGIALVKELGADEVIDYKSQDFAELLYDFDAVYDNVGGDDFNKALTVLKKGGIAVTMAAQIDEAVAIEHGITALGQMTHVTTDILNELTQLVEGGVVSAQISQVFPLDQVKEAYRAKENGDVDGKIVIEVR